MQHIFNIACTLNERYGKNNNEKLKLKYDFFSLTKFICRLDLTINWKYVQGCVKLSGQLDVTCEPAVESSALRQDNKTVYTELGG